MVTKEYSIQNLDCPNCSAKIEEEISNLSEVSSVNLDFINKRLTVQYQQQVDKPLQRLNAIASRIEPGVTITLATNNPTPIEKKPWFIILAIFILCISLFIAPSYANILGIIAYLIAGHRVLVKSLKELYSKQLFAEHFLMSIATLGAIYLGEYTEAAAVMVLYEVGQYLENKAINRSRDSIKSILALKPEKLHLLTPSGVIDKEVSEAIVGDTIMVYAGERIPLDGVVTKGESSVDTSSLTGEAEPVFVEGGTKVFAGFMNGSGLLEMEVQSTDSESMIARIIKLIEDASAKKSSTEKFMTRFSRYYTPLVVLAAILVFIIPTLLGYEAAVWFKRSLIFLIVSCPCALVISIPLSYYIGIGKAAKQGIIFKGSVYLDLLHKAKTLVFDKTGTLTTGDLRLSDILPSANNNTEELIHSLYLCEFTSSHPFAKAVKAAYSIPFNPSLVQSISEIPGRGITLIYEGISYISGSENYLLSLGFKDLQDSAAKSSVHVVKNNLYLGCVCFSDELKPNMKSALEALKAGGIKHFSMLSGDRKPKAELVAEYLGLDSYYAELVPAAKLSKLEEIMQANKGIVAYCGDGLNDAPVLARADVGIAMGSIGAQASIETADVVLLNDKPEQLQAAFDLSHRTSRLVWQNISLALGVKVLVMGFGLIGISGLWEAIIADVGVTLLVIFNSLRMLKSS
ncbi:MAG: heavy metal translocating P-type ATPase [Candidatus Cloacimonetes bacterium]|nr:heavy metal translocating P-type ATPase [Candidatus Cloacimonadota bacterium]